MSNVVSANKPSITKPLDSTNLVSDQHKINHHQVLSIKRESQNQAPNYPDHQNQVLASSNLNQLIDKSNNQQEVCDCMLFANLNHSTTIVAPVSGLIHNWQCTTYHNHQQNQFNHSQIQGSSSTSNQAVEYNYNSDINTVIISNNSNNHHYFAYAQTAASPESIKYHNIDNDNNYNKGVKRANESSNQRQPIIVTPQEATICKLSSKSSNSQNNKQVSEGIQVKQEGGGGGCGGGQEEEEEEELGSEEEDLNFDYEPVLAKILNEKKLVSI